MRIVSFEVGGRSSWGVVEPDGVVDLGRVPGLDHPDASAALRAETAMDIAMAACGRSADVALDEVRLRPPVPNPRTILWAGSHIATRRADTLVGQHAPVRWGGVPPGVGGGLAVVIGSPTWRVPVERAEEHVLGYSCFVGFPVGGSAPDIGACGPWIVTRDEMPTLAGRRLTTTLNGTVIQRHDLDDLPFSVPELVSFLSARTPLQPGDLVMTGAPGRTAPAWTGSGDRCAVEVDGIGTLVNEIVKDPAGG